MNLKTYALAIIIASLFGGASVMADQHASGMEISSIKAAPGLYMLTGKGGNLGVFIGAEGTFLIDDQYAPLSEDIQAAINALGGAAPRFLLNTHWHSDHTGGNENFGKAGALIVAHDNVRARLSVDNQISAFNATVPARQPEGLPVITFSSDLSLHLNDQIVHAIHVDNAHTDGDSIVHFPEANVIHTGDVWFNGFYPFIDIEHGGSLNGMIDAVEKVLELADEKTKIIPGHGPLGNKKQLENYHGMLSTVAQRIDQLKSQGKTKQQIISSNFIDDLDKEWGDGFLKKDKWLGLIIQE